MIFHVSNTDLVRIRCKDWSFLITRCSWSMHGLWQSSAFMINLLAFLDGYSVFESNLVSSFSTQEWITTNNFCIVPKPITKGRTNSTKVDNMQGAPRVHEDPLMECEGHWLSPEKSHYKGCYHGCKPELCLSN